MRVLFLQGFVSPDMDYKASDAVGWGITSAEAIIEGLSARGVDVVPVKPEPALHAGPGCLKAHGRILGAGA